MKCKYCGCLLSERKTGTFRHQEVSKIRKRITAFMIKVSVVSCESEKLQPVAHREKKKSCTDSVTKLFVKVRLVTDFWDETILLYHSIS